MTQSPAGAAATAPAPVTTPAARNIATTAPSPLPAQTGAAAKPRDTPRELRRLTTAVIIAGVVFGLAGLATFLLLAASVQRAEASTAQLIRVQEIQTNLLRADANATNAFLVGGLEPPDQRQAYDEAIIETARLIAEASDAEPADQAALAELNTQLLDYTENIELARANNRQGFPVGAQYLRTASGGLRADALPILDNLVAANSDRAESQMNARIAIAVRRDRRDRAGRPGLDTDPARSAVQAPVQRRAGGGHRCRRGHVGRQPDRPGLDRRHDRRHPERLVLRRPQRRDRADRGQQREVQREPDPDRPGLRQRRSRRPGRHPRPSCPTASRRFGRVIEVVWQPYVDVHTQIRQLDDGGQWDKAVQLATGESNTASTHLRRRRRRRGRPGQHRHHRRTRQRHALAGRSERSSRSLPAS